MNEGLLCKAEHKFNTSFNNDDDKEGLRLGMVWEGPATPSAGAQGHRGWGSKQHPSSVSPTGAAWLCHISGGDFKSFHRKGVRMCWSLEVSLALRRPLPGFDEAPSVEGPVINCGHAVCSCTCKSLAILWGLSTNENSLAFL